VSPRHADTAGVAGSKRIRVCVRKRPRMPAELRHNDADIVTVCSPGRVVVNELKSAIDLSKYVQKVGLTWPAALVCCTFVLFNMHFSQGSAAADLFYYFCISKKWLATHMLPLLAGSVYVAVSVYR